MARPKARWHGKILRQMFRDGGSIVLLGRMEHDPDRITEFRVNRSNITAFLSQVVKESDLDQDDITGLIDGLSRMVAPPAVTTAGKHANGDEY